MTSPTSPIVDFYPSTFRVDQEGKRNDWEGIVLVRLSLLFPLLYSYPHAPLLKLSLTISSVHCAFHYNSDCRGHCIRALQKRNDCYHAFERQRASQQRRQ